MAVEKTFVMIKPEAVMRGLIGNVIGRFEQTGLKIVAMKLKKATPDEVTGFYPSDEDWLGKVGDKTLKRSKDLGIDVKKRFGTDDRVTIGKQIKGWLVNFISASPVVLMVLEGNNAVEKVRKMAGYTDPIDAEPGSIRADFAQESIDWANFDGRAVFNIIHASGDPSEAKQEINHWFSPKEIFDYTNAFDMVMGKLTE